MQLKSSCHYQIGIELLILPRYLLKVCKILYIKCNPRILNDKKLFLEKIFIKIMHGRPHLKLALEVSEIITNDVLVNIQTDST